MAAMLGQASKRALWRTWELAERRGEPVDRRGHMRGVDVVGRVRLVVLDVEPALLEQRARLACEVDRHDRVVAPVGYERARALPVIEVRGPPLDHRHEAREREDPGRC